MRIGRLLRHFAVRVAAVYIGLFALSAMALLAFIYAVTVSLIDDQINAAILADINALSDNYREHGRQGLIDLISERIANDHAGDSIYLLVDGDGPAIAGNLSKWPSRAGKRDRWLNFELEPEGQDDSENSGPAPSDPVAARAMVFDLRDGARLLVGRTLQGRERFEDMITQSIVWSMSVVVAMALAGGVMMSRDMRRRLEVVNDTTRRIMDGDLSQRVPRIGSNDEFDKLAGNLNAMLGEINRLMTAKREVADNIAHDLRSPLTRIKARVEVSLSRDEDAAALRAALERTAADIDGVLSTFNALLSIAQAEAGAGRKDMITLDLVRLARDVAELYEPVAEEKAIALSFDAPAETAPVFANRHLLAQALANLVDNAIKYTPNGGTVRVTARPNAEGGFEVAVADSGPGVPEADRPRVLERFVRLDQSRSAKGAGLGLSLVAAVAGLHRAKLSLGDAQPGLIITFSLPPHPEAGRA